MKRIFRYIFRELFKAFLLGSVISIVVLLGLQFLRLSEMLVRFNIDKELLLKMVLGLSASFLPLVTPIAFLFACLVLFGRLASDREFVAMQSFGFPAAWTLKPALTVASIVALFSLWSSFSLGPTGNRKFEEFVDEAFRNKVTASLRSGTFSEGFLGLVIFADQVDSGMSQLRRVFIHDESSFKNKVSISAQRGVWSQNAATKSGVLSLHHGLLVSQVPESEIVRRIEFDTYNIFADFSRPTGTSRDSPPSLDVHELLRARSELQMRDNVDPRKIWVEIARRLALVVLPWLFAPLAFYLSFDTARTVRSRAIFTGLTILFSYWTLYFALVTFVLKTNIKLFLIHEWLTYAVVWIPNFIVLAIIISLAKMHNGGPNRFLARLGF